MKYDVMVDIEAMGQSPRGVICELAARKFLLNRGNRSSEIDLVGIPFQRTITMVGQEEIGRTCDPLTVTWWLGQSHEARDNILSETTSLTSVLLDFIQWLGKDRHLIWAHGSYDLPMLRDAFSSIGLSCPWRYTQERDIRTLIDIATRFGYTIPDKKDRPGGHQALNDVDYQIDYCCAAFNEISITTSGF